MLFYPGIHAFLVRRGRPLNLDLTIKFTLAALSLVALATGVGLLAALAVPGGRSWLRGRLGGLERHPIGWAAFVSLVAVSGSLYLSEIAGLVPCKLCWFQRIAMYPLLVVTGVALWRKDVGVWRYGLPLSVVGFGISAWHVTIQHLPCPEAATCQGGVPCSAIYLAFFGFVSIPVMAGAAFLLITAVLLLVRVLEGQRRAAE